VKRGMTCSSFTSVSLHPPIISFTIQLHSRMHKLLETTRQFAANILSEQQVTPVTKTGQLQCSFLSSAT
jgi:flavin reductase (DIM6/NTAB) family NADH-FMN oxidoreductase RutF